MAIRESFAGTIAEIAPSDRAGLPASIAFRNGARAQLPADQLTGSLRSRLELLRDLNWPAQVSVDAIDADNRLIQEVRIPVVGRVMEIRSVPEGTAIRFDRSSARHLLKPDAEGHDALQELFARSLNESTLLVVADDPRSHDIVSAAVAEDIVHRDNTPLRPRPEAEALDDAVLNQLTPITADEASQFMRRMDTVASCGLPGATADCIPFRYPDGGCFARAHRMCELLDADGIVAGKIWIYGNELSTATSDHPSCHVSWTWHVATVVKSADTARALVLDPPLFDEPVEVEAFVQRLDDPTAAVAITTMAPFIRERDGRFIPEGLTRSTGIDDTEAYLMIYREELAMRIPPPPYDCAC